MRRPFSIRWFRQPGWVFTAVLLCCLLLAACAASGQKAGGGPPKATTTGAIQPTPTAPSTPGPLGFSSTWNTVAGPLVVNTVTHPAASGAVSEIGPSGYTFAPSNPQTGYACVGVGASTTLYATRDGGATWRQLVPKPFTWCDDVFVDAQDASDVFATQAASGASSYSEYLWRSRDGGATWRKLAAAPVQSGSMVSQLVVIGTRVFINAVPGGVGVPANTLYYSDDGGASWAPLGRQLVSQGYAPSAFDVQGTTIYVSGSRTQSSDNTRYFWRSTDAGDSWTRVTFPGLPPVFAPAASGAGVYALSIEEDENASFTAHATITTFWWSADGGATWRKLPALAGAEHGYVVGGGRVIALAPDGSVFSQAEQSVPGSSASAFGIYRIQPNAPSPAWQPFAAAGVQQYGASWWQAVQTPKGVRLWGVEDDPNGQQSYLEYTAPN